MTERFSRQSFLGENSETILASAVVGVVGLGGGGSHVAQQLAHLGFMNFVLFDADTVELSNLNRLIGMHEADVTAQTAKTVIAERLIKGIRPEASVVAHQVRWQDLPQELKKCDLIFGCIDGFIPRRELEILARRYLIPYIDIGMDVLIPEDTGIPRVAGQVILTMPGGSCMRCTKFLSNDVTEREAGAYGDAGIHPQVVHANGVLASTAVSLAVELLTGWTKKPISSAYYSYDGNKMTLVEHPNHVYRPDSCSHFSLGDIGDPKFVAF